MPSNKVAVLIGGKFHDDWESYSIESDLMTPADAWQVSCGLRHGVLPVDIQPWADVVVKVGDDTVLTGRIDDDDEPLDKQSHTLSISGRDGAAVLVDCSAPIFSAKQVSLDDVIAKIVRPLGITRFRIDADKSEVREKISVDVGDTAWDVLSNVAEANGLWPWFDPDGTLVVGGPDYSKPPVATLIMRWSGKGNNLISLTRRRSVRDRYSEVTVLGQAPGTAIELGKNALKGVAIDKGFNGYRPKIVVDHEADSLRICDARARKLLADGRLAAFTLIAKVKGHRTDGGLLWLPRQRVNVISEPHGINGVFFLMARKFSGGRDQGTVTELTLKEDGVWLLDAHPHKRSYRKHRHKVPKDKSGKTSEVVEDAEFLDYL